MFAKVLNPVISALYPQQCHVCRDTVDLAEDGIACSACWTGTRLFDGSEALCGKCGAFREDRSLEKLDQCGDCRDAFYDRALACGVYERALAASIVQLKKVPHLPHRVVRSIESLFERAGFASNSVIVPVPLSKRRRFERGYNQAELIAHALSRFSGNQVVHNALVRTAHSPMHRVGMDKKAREATVAGAFEARTPRLFEGKEVVLVDDVFTSGSTASYCAKELKKKGADRVTVVTLARAVMYR